MRSWAAWMRGDRQEAISRLERQAEIRRSTSTRRSLDRLASSLALAADRPDLVRTGEARPLVAARAAWQRGDLKQAILDARSIHGPAAAYRRVLEGEFELLKPGVRLSTRTSPRPEASAPAAWKDGAHRPLRVMHLLTNSLPHTQSGYTLRSHEILQAQRALGFAVSAITRLGYPVTIGRLFARDLDVVDGIEYRRLLAPRLAPTPQGRLLQSLQQLLPIARQFRPDVIHTTTPYSNALIAQSLAELLDVPWTYEVRGMLEKTWAASRATSRARHDAESSERFALVQARETDLAGSADHVFTLSTAMRDELESRGVPVSRMSIVPNAISESLLDLAPTSLPDGQPAGSTADAARAFRSTLGLPVSGFWVGAVSSLVDYEGHDVLIDAVVNLRSAGHDVRMIIVGDGAARSSLERRIRSADLCHVAHLPGRVPPIRARDYLRALDAVAIPRLDLGVTRSVTPLKPIEAMAIGRPVILSDVPPLRELAGVDDESVSPKRALIVDPGDPVALAGAIDRVRRDLPLGVRLVDAGREFARTQTWRSNAHVYSSVFNDIVR